MSRAQHRRPSVRAGKDSHLSADAVAARVPAQQWLRELVAARTRYEELLDCLVTVDVQLRRLALAAGQVLDAVTMPATPGRGEAVSRLGGMPCAPCLAAASHTLVGNYPVALVSRSECGQLAVPMSSPRPRVRGGQPVLGLRDEHLVHRVAREELMSILDGLLVVLAPLWGTGPPRRRRTARHAASTAFRTIGRGRPSSRSARHDLRFGQLVPIRPGAGRKAVQGHPLGRPGAQPRHTGGGLVNTLADAERQVLAKTYEQLLEKVTRDWREATIAQVRTTLLGLTASADGVTALVDGPWSEMDGSLVTKRIVTAILASATVVTALARPVSGWCCPASSTRDSGVARDRLPGSRYPSPPPDGGGHRGPVGRGRERVSDPRPGTRRRQCRLGHGCVLKGAQC